MQTLYQLRSLASKDHGRKHYNAQQQGLSSTKLDYTPRTKQRFVFGVIFLRQIGAWFDKMNYPNSNRCCRRTTTFLRLRKHPFQSSGESPFQETHLFYQGEWKVGISSIPKSHPCQTQRGCCSCEGRIEDRIGGQ